MKKLFIGIVIFIGIFVIGGIGGVVFDYFIFSKITTNPVLSQNPIMKALDNRIKIIKTKEKVVVQDNDSIADIASRTSGSVVYVELVDDNGVKTSRSGIVLSSDGVVATTGFANNLKDNEVFVKLADNNVYKAHDIYHDFYTDITFMRIDAQNLTTVSFANSDTARSGKKLISIIRVRDDKNVHLALGGFLGHDYSFSIGEPKSDFLQGVLMIDFNDNILTVAEGAPVIDFESNMLGLVSSRVNKDAKEFYAIPANDVRNAFDEFLQNINASKEQRDNSVTFGINYALITPLDVFQKNMDISSGAIVELPQTRIGQTAFAKTLAAKAGIQNADIIIMVNNDIVDTRQNLSRLLHKHKNDEKITLKILRGSEVLSVELR